MNNKNKEKDNKAIILMVLAIIIIGIGVVILFLKGDLSSEEIANLNSIFDPNKPIVIKKDGKYGYITSEGKEMISAKYKSASEFNGNYAIVTVDNPDTNSYYKTIYQVIDKKGKVLNTSEGYSAPKYYSLYDVWVIDDILYDCKFNKVLADGIEVSYISDGYFEYEDIVKNESGIINYKGKKIFTFFLSYIYTDMSDNSNTENDLYVRVTKSSERDLIVSLKTGQVVYSLDDVKNNYLYAEDDNIFQEYNRNDKTSKYLFFINGKLAYQSSEQLYDLDVFDYENQILELDYGYNYESLGKSQRRYYYDLKNKQLLEEKPSSSNVDYDSDIDLMELTYGYKEFSSSGKYGLMSKDKVVIPCEYSDIEFLNSDLFNYMKSKGKELVLLEKDNITLLMNIKTKKTITTFDSTSIYDEDDSTFLKATIYENYSATGYIIYNLLSGKSMTLSKDDSYSIYSNYITIKKGNQKIYYNTNLKQIYVESL